MHAERQGRYLQHLLTPASAPPSLASKQAIARCYQIVSRLSFGPLCCHQGQVTGSQSAQLSSAQIIFPPTDPGSRIPDPKSKRERERATARRPKDDRVGHSCGIDLSALFDFERGGIGGKAYWCQEKRREEKFGCVKPDGKSWSGEAGPGSDVLGSRCGSRYRRYRIWRRQRCRVTYGLGALVLRSVSRLFPLVSSLHHQPASLPTPSTQPLSHSFNPISHTSLWPPL